MEGHKVGYVRVSTLDQNTQRQLEGVSLDKVFTDKASGKDTKRPQLQAALNHVRAGDSLIVHSMDRLARNVEDMLKEEFHDILTPVTFGTFAGGEAFGIKTDVLYWIFKAK